MKSDRFYKFYRLSKEEVIKHFRSNAIYGLSEKEAEKRIFQYGQNKLKQDARDSWFKVFIRQFNNPLIYILLIAAVIIYFVGPDKIDAFIITVVLFFNAILGTVQEGKARNILESLRNKNAIIYNHLHL